MKSRFLVLAALLGSTPLSFAHAADVQIVAQNPVIELSVSEQINSTPDTATFSTGVDTKAPTATQALRDNSAKANAMINTLKSLGIAEEDIQTTGINLNADYKYIQATRQNKFVGYRVSNQVRVKVRDISKLGDLLDALVSSGGANNLSGPFFSLEDNSEVKKAARRRALENGRKQAEEYARSSGFSSVKILSISEALRNMSSGRYDVVEESRAIAVSNAPPPVAPGQVGTTVNLAITYEMVP